MQENYFDHDTDIGIIGREKSTKDCFINRAYAMFSMMSDLSRVHPPKDSR